MLRQDHHQHYRHRGKDSELTATHVGSPRLLLLLSVPRAKRTQPFRRIENCAHSRVNEIQAESPHSRGRGTLLLSIDGLGALDLPSNTRISRMMTTMRARRRDS